MANDFMSGMKDAMSLFMMSSLASNYQAQQENMVENRQMRELNIARQLAEDQRQTQQADFTMSALATDPTKGVPLDVALQHLNSTSAKYGNKQVVTIDQYNRYLNDLDQFMARTDLPTAEARREAFTPLAEQATRHAGYYRALLTRNDRLTDFMERPAANAAFATSGFSPETSDRLLTNLRPGQALALLKDNDWRKTAIYNQASQTKQKVMNGEDVPDGALQRDLAAAYGAGFHIDNDAAEIIKGTMGEAQYNLAQKDVSSLNETSVKPLSKLWGMLDQDKLIQTVVHPGRSQSLATLYEGTTDVVARLLKTPEQQAQFQEALAKTEATAEQAKKNWDDFQARYKIAKANPQTSPADVILLDQQMKLEREKVKALSAPYAAFNQFVEVPTAANYKKVLDASKDLEGTLRRWEGEKQKLLTVSEEKTKFEIDNGKLTANTKQATNDAQAQLIDAMQRDKVQRADEQRVRELASPIIQSVNAKYNVKIDVDELLKAFKPAESTLTVKFPGESERKDIAETANLLQGFNLVESLYDPSYVGMVQGKIGSAQEATGAISQTQADFYQATDNISRGLRKFFGGVAVTPTELKLLLGTIPNRNMSDEQFTSSVRMNKIILGGDAKQKIEVLKQLGFKTPEKVAASIDEALTKAKGEVEAGKTPTKKKTEATMQGAFTPERYNALKKKHPDWSPADIGRALARGEE